MNDPAHTAPAPRGNAAAILLCFLIAVLEGYDIQAFGVSAPRLVADLGINAEQQGFAASLAMVGLIIGAVGGGWIADRAGRRPILIAAVLVFGIGSVWTGLVGSYAPLLAARLVTGIGFGGALPLLIAVAAEVSRPERRALTTSFMFCGMPIGGAGVSLFAGLAHGADAWRWIFVFGGVLPLLLAFAIGRVLPETRPARNEEGGGVVAALFGNGRAIATLLLWGVNFFTLVMLYLLLNWLPSLVVATGHSAAVGAIAALCFNLIGAAGALSFGWLVDRYGFRAPLPLCYLALAASLLLLSRVAGMEAILILSAVCGFFTMGAQYALYGLPPALYPASARGVGAGAAVALGRLGSIVGPIMAGVARQDGWSPADVLRMLVPVALLAGVTVVLLSLSRAVRGWSGRRSGQATEGGSE